VATGAGPLSYQWYRGMAGDTSNPVTGATTSTLVTSPIAVTTRFWVRVTNSTSSVDSAAATVTPYFAPSITTQPASREVATGTTASLSVVAAGSGPFVYQWFRGASGDTSSPIAGATGSGLTTPAITQVSQFWVRVGDGINSVNSATAILTPYTPLSITTQPADRVVAPGSTASLSVVAAGSGPFTYQWYRGLSGDTSSPVAGATSSSLTTPAITQASRFWVRVGDGRTTLDSRAALVNPRVQVFIPHFRR
jgi:hypothetical protein